MTSTGNSIIDNQTLNYIHYAWDWPATNGLRIERIHRYRDMDRQSSFGPGVFSNFDAQLRIFDIGDSSNSLPVVEVFDPLANSARRMMPAIASDQSRFIDNNSVTNSYQYKTSPLAHDDALKSHAYRELRLFDASGQPTASDYTQAVAAELVLHSGDVFHFEIIQAGSEFIDIDTGDAFLQPRDGRLVAIRDHTDRGMTITYKTWTAAELQESPERQWQIDTITDAHGVSVQFHYGQTQVATRWAVSQIDLPNGESVSYTYENDQITAVNHPDGSQSTFAYGWEPTSQTTSLTFFDPSAEGTHRTKQVYLSNNLANIDDLVFTSSSNLVRVVANGDGEVTYLNMQTGPSNQMYVYEGAGKMFYPSGGNHWTDGWDINEPAPEIPVLWGGNLPQTNLNDTSNRLEPNGTTWGYPGDSLSFSVGAPAYINNEHGTTTQYTYTTTNAALASVTHPDGSTESYTRDSEDRVTMYTDRLGRSRQFTYDDRGNLTKLDLFKWTAADDFYDDYWDGDDTYGDYGQENYTENNIQATWNWEYFPAGHVNEFMLAAFIDANSNRTDYEYDGNHRISKVIEPPDFEGDPRATTDYTWDNIGRLTAISDPSGSVRQFEYDNRNRLIKTTYSDGTSKRNFYGTGANANLVVRSKDRRGVLTDYEYDATGRVTKTILAAGNMDESGSEFPLSSPTVTVENTVEYLNGTELPATTVSAGSKTDYTYDYKHRLVAKSVYPNTETTLTTHNIYVDNRKLYEQDAYGRRKYFGYDNSSGRMIRTIQGTVPEFLPDGESAYFDGDAFASAYFGEGTTLAQLLDYIEDEGGYAGEDGEDGYGMYFDINDIIMSQVRKPDPDVNGHAIIIDTVHDHVGQILEQIDGRGIRAKHKFDANSRTVLVQAAYGTNDEARIERDFDAQGNTIEIRSPRYFDPDDVNGFQKCRTVNTYTGRNLIATRHESPDAAEGAIESFAYDSAKRRVSYTDFMGNVSQTIYPSCCGRSVVKIDPLGDGTIIHQDAGGNTTHIIAVADVAAQSDIHNPEAAKTIREMTARYDERGRRIASTIWLDPLDSVDSDYPMIAGEDGISIEYGLTSKTIYDNDMTDGDNLDQEFSNAIVGLAGAHYATLSSDADGSRSLLIYDAVGRHLRSAQLDSNGNSLWSQTQSYDTVVTSGSFGSIVETSTSNLLNQTTRNQIDGAGRIIGIVEPNEAIVQIQYDSSGNRISIRDTLGIGIDNVYNARGQHIQNADTKQLIDGVNQQRLFDTSGNIISEIDAKGKASNMLYDARERLVSHTDRLGATTTWTYDPNGNELTITDAEQMTTSYTYDPTGRQTAVQWPAHVPGAQLGDPGYAIELTEYDLLGRPVRQTDQSGDTITTIFNLAGQMERRQYRSSQHSPAGVIQDEDVFTYDRAGRVLTGHTDRYDNTVSFVYDDAGRKISESLAYGNQIYTVLTSYDAANRILTHTYPDGAQVDHTYTERSQLESIVYDGTTVATRTYDDAGRMVSNSYSNGVSEFRTYNLDNTVNTITHSGAAVGDHAYSWDANKNKTSELITGGRSAYSFSTGSAGHDNEDRLVEFNQGSLVRSWDLSPVGNWSGVTENGSAISYVYGASHELQSSAGVGIAYDSNGNATFIPSILHGNHDSLSLQWDSDDRLSSASINADGADEVTFDYDASGRKISRTTTAGTVVYIPSGNKTIADYNLGDLPASPKFKYLYGPYADEPILRVGADGLRFFHRNQQFSVVALTDEDGDIVEQYAYAAYGAPTFLDANGVVLGQSNEQNRFTFTGREWDEALRLYHYRSRVYDPFNGRFLTEDPLEYVDGPARYAYVGSSPLARLDPSGLSLIDGAFNRIQVSGGGCFSWTLPGPGPGATTISICGSAEFIDCCNDLDYREYWGRICATGSAEYELGKVIPLPGGPGPKGKDRNKRVPHPCPEDAGLKPGATVKKKNLDMAKKKCIFKRPGHGTGSGGASTWGCPEPGCTYSGWASGTARGGVMVGVTGTVDFPFKSPFNFPDDVVSGFTIGWTGGIGASISVSVTFKGCCAHLITTRDCCKNGSF